MLHLCLEKPLLGLWVPLLCLAAVPVLVKALPGKYAALLRKPWARWVPQLCLYL